MEMELEPRVKPLTYKVKAMSRESPSQKAAHVLDSDLRTHWSTGTNTKEWILLELDEPCLLSHIKIYNKSVLEWEFTVGLRYKPENFVKVRPRCEAPRREMVYPMNYTPCRYVRISCLRGNPIAIFFIQLIGVSVTGLEPEFQPVVNYLLPDIISHKQDAHDMHLQLLQDVTNRLLVFLPQLETDLINFSEAAEPNIRFLAMLVGPFYPIIHILNDREKERASLTFTDSDLLRNKLTSTLTVSSNFEVQPRRSRSPSPLIQPLSSSVAFRPEAVFMLLRKAYKDPHLGIVCRAASRVLHKFIKPTAFAEALIPTGDADASSYNDDGVKPQAPYHLDLTDYSSLFGEDFRIPDDNWDLSYMNLLDIASVEEGILHVLYACASQPHLCCKLADNDSDIWSVLPLIQALLPALRPPVSSPPYQVDDSFSQWKHPPVQNALSQIIAVSSSSVLRPLLGVCAGYLSSFLPSHASAACVLIDLCSGPLSPWIPIVIAKVDLAMELLEDLLGTIQCARWYIARARASLKYIILALSGHVDDILAKYKEVKHKLLFLVEMLEAFLDPAITATKSTIAFGDVSTVFLEKKEQTCAIALNVIRTAVQRPAVLPSLESEWRRGSVAPSVLLSILGPHMPLPSEIDTCKCSMSKSTKEDSSPASSGLSVSHHELSTRFNSLDESDGKYDLIEANVKMGIFEDANLLFAPPELKTMILGSSNIFGRISPDRNYSESSCGSAKEKLHSENTSHNRIQNSLSLNKVSSVEYISLQADYLQLVNLEDCELRASEFQRLALDLHSQQGITPEGHEAAIDALLLAAECYVNPFFMISFRSTPEHLNKANTSGGKMYQKNEIIEMARDFKKNIHSLETVSHLERKRDKIVLEILLQAADLDKEYQQNASQQYPYEIEKNGWGIEISETDMQSADAITLVRKNQALLCKFLTEHLLSQQKNLHEVLLQSLLFYLQSATELFCPPENVISIIIQSAEHLNATLTSFYHQFKAGNRKLDPEKLHGIRRRWLLLQRLVMASSGGVDELDSKNTMDGFRYGSLVPFSSWMLKISTFSESPFPLARFLCWMAISHFAKQYLKEQLFLDLSQLTSLLSIFSDELALVDDTFNQKSESPKLEFSGPKHHDNKSGHCNNPNFQESLCVLYPDLHKFFPDMKVQFRTFGEIILEVIGLQLKSLPSVAISDILCWFSELCLSPFLEKENEQVYSANSVYQSGNHLRGHAGRNAKAIVLYLLEAIVCEHMEAMVPEMPRVAQLLVSLCKTSYSDVPFLDSVLHLLKPLISYALTKVDGEKLLISDYPCYDFETLCFEELLNKIKCGKGCHDSSGEKKCQGPLVIFILGSLFPDLSLLRKKEILQSLSMWADFASSEPTSSYFDYLCAFQKVMESCVNLLVHSLEKVGIQVPDQECFSSMKITYTPADSSKYPSGRSNNEDQSTLLSGINEGSETAYNGAGVSIKRVSNLSLKDTEDVSKVLEDLFLKLYPSIELCWKLHFQLASKLTVESTKCCMFLRCLTSVSCAAANIGDRDCEDIHPTQAIDTQCKHWSTALEGCTATVLTCQRNHCWHVASAMLDYLVGLPEVFSLDCAIPGICSAIKNFCSHAPRISWRLQTDKWLSSLITKAIGPLHGDEAYFVDLFCTMLGHSEPEQRSVALKHLGRLVGLDIYDEVTKLSYMVHRDSTSAKTSLCKSEATLSNLVSSTWDKVAALASSDPLLLLRANSMALLSGYIPFADRRQLQAFFVEADRILPGLGTHVFPIQEPLLRFSLGLLACACLHSPMEDISLIPESAWTNLERMAVSKSGLNGMEKKVCQALCELRTEVGDAKEVLNEMIGSNSAAKLNDPNFKSIRESILQVLSSLASVESYFDFFSKRIDQESQELEEAEIEMDLLQKDKALQEVSERSLEESRPVPIMSYHSEDTNRLNKLKNEIRDLERSKLREEIAARMQKKLLARRSRQKYLEEAALREMELLQELDRERTSEVEREIERQKLLELERAKTRELRHNLDIERERQAQRELQRELEQAESGVQSSRREFSSNPSSRPRERYRDRENGRSGLEGSMRPSSRGRESNPQPTSSGPSSTPSVLLAGSRSFSGQLPTILQSRDRSDERITGYEDSIEGSRDSGDAGSVGDPDTGPAFDGLTGGFGAAPRQGSRGSRSRQIVERRERDGRREGKWERKHS